MDRLLTGDVGYGKTEIAVRAAFKAIQDGKRGGGPRPDDPARQQHIGRYPERCAGFPMTIAALSLLNAKKEVEEVKSRARLGAKSTS